MLVYGVHGTVKLTQGEGIKPCVPGGGEAPNRQTPAADHGDLREWCRASLRCDLNPCTEHKDHDS
ncbi:hypothetical protein AHAS_Ahas11G0132800 [Arachis hypogaea]|uniref:Uncharacterized protein n=1 Tax=Arachis hypogaea TaxID=3818 RepID=A0A445ARR0_ARAHY|nr:hypothetical protein Ahy_B01g053362 isoform B [Arachis hypogaea]